MNIIVRIIGAFLPLVGGYVFLSATRDLVVGKLGLPVWTYALDFAVWFLLVFASLATIVLGLIFVFGSHRIGMRLRMTDSIWLSGRSRSIMALLSGLIVIIMLLAGPFYIDEISFTLEYLTSVFMLRLVAGISSIVYGIMLWH